VSYYETEAMRITGNDNQPATAFSRARSVARQTSSDAADAADTSECRALVPVAPVQSASRATTVVRQPAGFLAQLIATQQSLPQTRERRRIDPQVGAAIYAHAGKPAATLPPHALRRAA
jgi:hypothetical protein